MKRKKKGVLADRKALSPVVANIILCAVVLALGMSIWTFSYSLTSVLESNYYEGVQVQIDAVGERFTVEHVTYSFSEEKLHVWVYNYGDVDIMVDMYVKGDAEGSNSTGTAVAWGDMVEIEVSLTAEEIYELSITVMSRRQNFVYATYVVPST